MREMISSLLESVSLAKAFLLEKIALPLKGTLVYNGLWCPFSSLYLDEMPKSIK